LFVQKIASVAAGGPKRHVAILAQCAAFLPTADAVEWPRVKRFPNWAKHFVNVRNAFVRAPNGCVPWDAVMLIDDEIEGFLRGVPFACSHPRGEFSSAANDVDAINDLFRIASGKFIGKPRDLVATLHEATQIGVGNTLGAAGEWIARVAPVKHQKSHAAQSSPWRARAAMKKPFFASICLTARSSRT